MNVLIVALEAVTDAEVSEAEALVVAPALNSRLRRWLSDEDQARRRAQRLAEAFVELLQQSGVHAEGRVGDADPLLAVADALPTFPADAIVIAGRPPELPGLDELVARMRERFGLPIRRTDSLRRAA